MTSAQPLAASRDVGRTRTASTRADRVISKDGTPIAFERTGRGPALILVDGALCHRRMGPCTPLAKLLAPHFTVFTYDRRGRGESGDQAPYAIEREIEDIEALLDEAGGSAFVWGCSSGAVLALEAATRLSGIRKLALYEAPFIVDDSRPPTTPDWVRIHDALRADRRSDAVIAFMKSVGVPAPVIAVMRLMPFWSKLKAVAPTLAYDGALVEEQQRGLPLPAGRWASATMPALVMNGGKSPTWLRHASSSLASLLPMAQHRTLDGQTHIVKPKVHAPVIVDFFAS